MLLIKQIQNLKLDRNNFMDNESHKNTWNNFTKFVLWGTVAVIGVLVLNIFATSKTECELLLLIL